MPLFVNRYTLIVGVGLVCGINIFNLIFIIYNDRQ
jgi:hypothetical protein